MAESVESGSSLEVSVSFGRFENDALSWEKWSSFSPNKYLEEVGSLSTPGSVAQKKAYFEAHYKKIAAKKAEELAQENTSEESVTTPSQDEQNSKDFLDNLSGNDMEDGLCNGSNSSDEIANEISGIVLKNETIVVDEAKYDETKVVEQGICANGLIKEIILEEEDEKNEEIKEATSILEVIPKLKIGVDEVLIREEIPKKESRKIAEKSTLKKESSKPNARNTAQKATPIKPEKIKPIGTKKKVVASPAAPVKPSLTTPKYSKPTFISPPVSSSQFVKKKRNESPVTKSKNVLLLESKKSSAPTSLHMSLSLGTTNYLAMNRKSLIMERMGDKDIVKRAFKSFKNQMNGQLNDEKSVNSKQVSSIASELKISTSVIHRKENKGLRKAAEKTIIRKNQLGHQSKPLSPESHKSSEVSRKNAKGVSPSINLKSDERAEKRKEFLKNLEAKSIAREAESVKLRAKSKDEKDSEIKKLRQSLNFKATPMPSFYRGKGLSEKEVVGNKIHH